MALASCRPFTSHWKADPTLNGIGDDDDVKKLTSSLHLQSSFELPTQEPSKKSKRERENEEGVLIIDNGAQPDLFHCYSSPPRLHIPHPMYI